MKRYMCNGKKGYCDRGNDNKIDCTACEFADGRGGEIVDCPDTNYEKIKAMSVDEMAELLERNANCEKFCVFTTDEVCNAHGNVCLEGITRWLESEVEEE